MQKNLRGLGRCSRCLRRAQAEVVYVAEPGGDPIARKLCATHLAAVGNLPTPVQMRGVPGAPTSRISS